MSIQKQHEHTAPKTDGIIPSGNKSAQAAADKVKAALDAIPVDQDALLLAERNDVIDAVLDRFGPNGERWIIGALAYDRRSGAFSNFEYHALVSRYAEEEAEKLRTHGTKFCAIGGLAAEFGPHSAAAIQAAISAIAEVIQPNRDGKHRGYGFDDAETVFTFNDDQPAGSGFPLIQEAFRQAKLQPLRKK